MFEENWQAVCLFIRLDTQWVYLAGMSGAHAVGLNYASVEFLFTLLEVKDRLAVFDDLQIMEAEARSLMNAKGG